MDDNPGGPRGKRAALRVLSAGPGGKADRDPLVWHARQEAAHYRTRWRLLYNLAPTDPRFLDATDEEILTDLLVRRFRADADWREQYPDLAFAEDLERSPGAADSLKRLKDRVLKDSATEARVRAAAGGGTTGPAPGDQPGRRLRVRGTVLGGGKRSVRP